MAQKEFKKANFAKLFNYNCLQYISWSLKNSKTVDTLGFMFYGKKDSCCLLVLNGLKVLDTQIKAAKIFFSPFTSALCHYNLCLSTSGVRLLIFPAKY